jgi:hypothetical protein
MAEQKQRHVDLLGPVLLIAAGVILLLNVLGVLEWSVWWSLIRLWPVFLIALGLDLLIGRRSTWGSLLVVVIFVGIVLGAFWFSRTDLVLTRAAPGQEIRQPLEGATEARVVVEPGVRLLNIEALPEAANLVEGTVQLAEGEALDSEFSSGNGRVTLELRTEQSSWDPLAVGFGSLRTWDLGLSPAPALQLETELGMGEVRLDLTGLALEDLQTSMGVGFTSVTLPAQGRIQANVNGAVGLMTIVIPEGLEARIRVDSGLAVRAMPDGYQQEGDLYTSPGYGTAEDRVELNASQAIGLLEIISRE